MNTSPCLPRSPELMSTGDTALLVVDMQEKVVAQIKHHLRLSWNIRRLIDAAKILGVPAIATEHYPKGLGRTIAELASRLGKPPEKTTFSCGQCGDVFRQWAGANVAKVMVVGIETHVCVQQTVLDLLAYGLRVYVAADATSARFDIDHHTALRRMESSGATLTTVESAMFEWCHDSARPEFKQISALVKERAPE